MCGRELAFKRKQYEAAAQKTKHVDQARNLGQKDEYVDA